MTNNATNNYIYYIIYNYIIIHINKLYVNHNSSVQQNNIPGTPETNTVVSISWHPVIQ